MHIQKLQLRGFRCFDQASDLVLMAREGYWSVWRTVFADQPEVVAALHDPQHFPGTRPQHS